MTDRFDAEEILRAAASGAFPNTGDVLLRTDDGWIFGIFDSSSIDVDFADITGIIDDRDQLPAAIAYEDEVNTFTERNNFSGQLSAPNFEAWVRFNRR